MIKATLRPYSKSKSKSSKRLNTFIVSILLTTLFLASFNQVQAQTTIPPTAPQPPAPDIRTASSQGNQMLPSLALQVMVTPDQVAIGETATATLTVTNQAPYTANNLTLDLTLPAGAKIDEASTRAGSATTTGWQWTQSVLEGNNSATFTATIVVQAIPPGEALFLKAQASSREVKDLNPAVGGVVVIDRQLEKTPVTSSYVPGQNTKFKADNNSNGGSGIEVSFGQKAYSKPLTLKKLSLALKEPELRAINVAAPPQRATWKKGFETFFLEAQDDQGQAVTRFDEPISIALHYTSEQLAALHITEDDLTLFWYDDINEYYSEDGKTRLPGKWVTIDTAIDHDGHTAVAQVNHFSAYQFGDGSSASSGFIPSLQGFQENLYTGSGSYAYPFDIPAGTGGIKPSLSLDYNSAATDGVGGTRTSLQAGWAGKGWSLDTGSISLNKVASGLGYYTMVLNGRSYDLTRGASIGTNSYLWTSINDDYIKVKSMPNGNSYTGSPGRGGFINGTPISRLKWQVQTKDGTLYEFAEDMWWGWSTNCSTDGTFEPYKFMLSKVVDTHGNTVTYNYGRLSGTTLYGPCYTYTGYADWDIWPTSITWGGVGGNPSTDRFKIEFRSSDRTNDINYETASGQFGYSPRETKQLNNITIWSKQSSTWELMRGYGFAHNYDLYSDASAVDANNHYTLPTVYHKLTLNSITRYGKDATIDGNGNISGSALPATTFTYLLTRGSTDKFPNGGWNRLTGINNGQGGTISLVYENIGPIEYPLTWNYMAFSNNHRLTSKTLNDGQGNAYTWTYSGYQNPVYNTLGITLGGNPAGPNTTTNSAVLYYNKYIVGSDISNQLAHAANKEFRGHSYVKVTAPDGTQTEHWFNQGFADCNNDGTFDNPTGTGAGLVNGTCFQLLRNQEILKGKEIRARVLGPSPTNAVYTDTFNTYQVNFIDYGSSAQNGLWHYFSFQSQLDAKNYEGQATPQIKTTKYYYDPAYQGGVQYANLTKTEDYNGSNLYRKTERWFATLDNGTNYIVDRPTGELISDAAGNGLALSHNFYDNQSTLGSFTTKGELTLTRKYSNVPSAITNFPLQGIDASFGYDSYGNNTTVTSYASPGTSSINGSGTWTFSSPGNGSTARTTTTTYDSAFHVYSTTTTYPTVNTITLSETAGYDYRMGLMNSITDPKVSQRQLNMTCLAGWWPCINPVLHSTQAGPATTTIT